MADGAILITDDLINHIYIYIFDKRFIAVYRDLFTYELSCGPQYMKR